MLSLVELLRWPGVVAFGLLLAARLARLKIDTDKGLEALISNLSKRVDSGDAVVKQLAEDWSKAKLSDAWKRMQR